MCACVLSFSRWLLILVHLFEMLIEAVVVFELQRVNTFIVNPN